MNMLDALQSALALTLVHSIWQCAALALLAACALALARRRSAALRYALGMLFLLAMGAAPLYTFARLFAARYDDGAAALASHVIGFGGSAAPPLWTGWLWGAGVVAMLLRLAGGWWSVQRLGMQQTVPLPPAWRERAQALVQAFGIARPVVVRVLARGAVPFTTGSLRPVVWLPAVMLTRLPSEQVEAILAHELAHVARFDWLWNGLQCAIEALLFHHPAMWWLSRRIREEREHACDDRAVAVCSDAIVLAEALVTLERLRAPVPLPALSARGGALLQRIGRLLAADAPMPQRRRAPFGFVALLAAGTLLVALAAPAGAVQQTGSAPWWLSAGSGFTFETDVDGEQRVYRRWVDPFGQPREQYTVDGVVTPIDAEVRTWLVAAIDAIPPPPAPPAPPPPRPDPPAGVDASSAPPSPPDPPAPPSPP